MSERAESVLSDLSHLFAELQESGEVQAAVIIEQARTLIIELEGTLENQQQILHDKEKFAGHCVGPMKECKICQEVLNFGETA